MIDDKVRIAELEQRLWDLRKAAVSMLVGMADAMAQSPGERAELAQTFEDVAQDEPGEMQHLSRLVAAALRAKS